jgi:pyrimidine-nucleoside phosphorylase/thymidine phosphorylase
MEQPLGRAIGNALEIRECIDFLQGRGPEDLETVSLALAAHMIRLGGRAKSVQQASRMAYEAVSTGAAADRFRRIIQAQGGDGRVVDNPDLLPRTAFIEAFRSPRDGYVARCDAKLLGQASNVLGAGRNRVDDIVHPAVGLYLERKVGDRVRRGEILCQIHWNDKKRLQHALPLIEESFEVNSRRPSRRPLIHAILEG